MEVVVAFMICGRHKAPLSHQTWLGTWNWSVWCGEFSDEAIIRLRCYGGFWIKLCLMYLSLSEQISQRLLLLLWLNQF